MLVTEFEDVGGRGPIWKYDEGFQGVGAADLSHMLKSMKTETSMIESLVKTEAWCLIHTCRQPSDSWHPTYVRLAG